MFFLSPLGGFRTLRSATRGLWVSPAGSVGAAAPGSGVHRTPAPPGPLPPFEKGGPKLYTPSFSHINLPRQNVNYFAGVKRYYFQVQGDFCPGEKPGNGLPDPLDPCHPLKRVHLSFIPLPFLIQIYPGRM